jgi:hypothetical protein
MRVIRCAWGEVAIGGRAFAAGGIKSEKAEYLTSEVFTGWGGLSVKP